MPSIGADVRRARIATFGFFALNGYVLGLWLAGRALSEPERELVT